MPDRIYAQYRDKPKAVKWFNIVPELTEELRTALTDVRFSYDIDNASGAALDVIGRIVVLDRGFESVVSFSPETYYGGDNIESQYGLESQYEDVGAKLSQEVSDSIFRILIRAKIAKNNSDSTLDGIVTALGYITDVNDIQVIDGEDMTFSVSFGSELNDIERFVFNTFDVVPRPQGVRFSGYVEESSITQYGGEFGYGDVNAEYGFYFGV